MKVNFLKRLESSIKSFEITMERTVAKIESLEKRLLEFQAHRASQDDTIGNELPDEVEVEDEELAEAFEVGKALKYQMADLQVDRWLGGP